jgi:hypothetical protein
MLGTLKCSGSVHLSSLSSSSPHELGRGGKEEEVDVVRDKRSMIGTEGPGHTRG